MAFCLFFFFFFCFCFLAWTFSAMSDLYIIHFVLHTTSHHLTLSVRSVFHIMARVRVDVEAWDWTLLFRPLRPQHELNASRS